MGSMAASPWHVVAVPYPGRGHVNAMLNLGSASSPAPRVRFEAIPNVIPSEHGRANDMAGFLDAVYTKMAAPFERLLDALAPPAPAAIVADVFVPWAVGVDARRGVPVCVMCPISATMFAVQYNLHLLPPAALGGDASPDVADDPSCLIENYIPGTKSIRFADLAPTHTNATMRGKILEAYASVKKAQCIVFTSFQELECDAIDAMRRTLPCPVYAVGPCIPFMALQEQHTATAEDADGYTAWLDAQPAGSVLYVSLGSFLSVSAAQFDEIAAGLAESKTRFLWVLRDADARCRVRSLVVHGHDAGLVVPWTDQLRVLCHPSVGGFFTHCGMNSTLEAGRVRRGALVDPAHRPTISRLVVELWKTRLGLKEKARADGVIGREEIAVAVETLMCPDATEDMRKRAALLKDAARAASEEGGFSWKDVTIKLLQNGKNQPSENPRQAPEQQPIPFRGSRVGADQYPSAFPEEQHIKRLYELKHSMFFG
ncbi:hypothetical protein U9M48_044397 [Paspalum notatum var. saurae]|uniref:Glycosyltransferase n=1 Tax=Paspalum notatum var. saurae TaxID=547442 RepID=A0AAQ3XID1_PASNO